MQALKNFLDAKNRRITRGQELPADYDKQTLEHYPRLGMVGEPAKAPKPPRAAKAPKPSETKPAGPQETGTAQPDDVATDLPGEQPEFPQQDPDRKGGENNPLTDADAAADLAGQPRPA